MTNSKLPWYKDGLRFECTQCGKCCTGATGFVWISEDEMVSMALTLDMPLAIFKKRFIRSRDNRYTLIEKKNKNNKYDCIFLKNGKCEVYQNRPLQCRTFPWWQENLNSEESWCLAAVECEGINDQAPLVSYETILINRT